METSSPPPPQQHPYSPTQRPNWRTNMSPPSSPPPRPKRSSFETYINPNPIPASTFNLSYHSSTSNAHAMQNALKAVESILPQQTEAEADEILCAAWTPGSKVQTIPNSHTQREEMCVQEGKGKGEMGMEEIIQLRIRLAVLENDLKHEIQVKESMMSSLTTILGVVAGQISGVGPVPQPATMTSDRNDIRALEKEIERLRRENRGLRGEAKRASRQSQHQSQHQSQPQSDPQIEGEATRQDKPKDEREQLKRLFPSNDLAYSGPNLTELAGSWATSKSIQQPAQSFETEISTIPSTSFERSFANTWKGKGKEIGNADVGIDTSGEWDGDSQDGDVLPSPGDEVIQNHGSSTVVSTPDTQHEDEQQTPSTDSSTSWGLSARHHEVSAEDIKASSLNGYLHKPEDYSTEYQISDSPNPESSTSSTSTPTPQPSSSSSSSPSSSSKITPAEEAQIVDLSSILDNPMPLDQQLALQRLALANFSSMPKPGKLMVNTDLDISTSFKGKEYDYLKLKAPIGPAVRYERGGGGEGTWRALGLKRGDTLDTLRDGERGSGNGQLQGIWDDRDQRERAIQMHSKLFGNDGGRGGAKFPDFFKHGLQFIPSETASNYLRTVMIENLPEGITLRDVLARVRGGEVLNATLVDTTSLTGNWTARVVFKHEAAAEEYTVWASKNPITFGDDHVPATVTLVTTPTYPLKSPIAVRLQRNPTHTRCFQIPNFPEHLSIRETERQLADKNQLRAEALLEIYLDEEANLHFEYANVDIAGSAVAMVDNFKWFRANALKAEWECDPCAGPLEELLEEVKPRPHMVPRLFSPPPVNEDSFHSNQHRGLFTQNRAGDGLDEQVLSLQRQQLAALTHQKVFIPSFSTDRLKGPSWADEMEEEEENTCVAGSQSADANIQGSDSDKPAKPFVASWGMEMGSIDAVLSSSASEPNEIVGEVDNTNLHSSLTGLSGSKYAGQTQRLSAPASSLSNPGQGYDVRDDEDVFNSGLRSPPKVNLADLIGSSDGEDSSESENSVRAASTKGKGTAFDAESGSVFACESESEKDGRPSLADKVFDSEEAKIDEENLVLPIPDLDVDAVKGGLEMTPEDDISEHMGGLKLDTPKGVSRGDSGGKNVPTQQEHSSRVEKLELKGNEVVEAWMSIRARGSGAMRVNPDEIVLDEDDDYADDLLF